MAETKNSKETQRLSGVLHLNSNNWIKTFNFWGLDPHAAG